ncbi:hypothetical protein KFK09_003784 [Dendrobium nobile]|uniref:NAC domain-containing protein n=1 Tax=Dendrobium nobile TaxID=94219 RepID=A0A8T3BYL9_DENNO|nr:hypothetical protein KFK09_003784 [Dendrobium nobile]
MECCALQGSRFPPGFRFHPTDQELIIHYLRKKITASFPPLPAIIGDIDLYKFNPWELPEKALFGQEEWFFFSPRDRKYPNGFRPNRAAASGFWKAIGTDKPILSSGGSECLGVKKALVFYKGRPPKGVKTDWVMHEYRLLDNNPSHHLLHKEKGSMRLDDWVLCRVQQKGSFTGENIENLEIRSSKPAIISSNESQGRQEVMNEYEISNYIDWNNPQLLSYCLESSFGGKNNEEILISDSVVGWSQI